MASRRTVGLAAIAALGMMASAARAQDLNDRSGLYLAGTVGYTLPSDPDIEIEATGSEFELDLDDGLDGTVALGAYLGAFRFEVEGAYRYNELEGTDTGLFGLGELDGHVQSASGMINALFDIPLGDRVQIYLGGGAGAAWVEGDFEADLFIGPSFSDSEDDWVFAYQAMAGVAFVLSDNVTLTTGYRFWSTEDWDFDGVSVDAPYFHTIEVGVRFSF